MVGTTLLFKLVFGFPSKLLFQEIFLLEVYFYNTIRTWIIQKFNYNKISKWDPFESCSLISSIDRDPKIVKKKLAFVSTLNIKFMR